MLRIAKEIERGSDFDEAAMLHDGNLVARLVAGLGYDG
jgi:hypothetical protein